MKAGYKLYFFSFFLFLFLAIDVSAQVYDRRGQAIYVEFIGQGFIYSVNYETRFAEKTEGLGARIGIGSIGSWTSVPVNINIMLGKDDKNHFLELGAGATFMFYKDPEMFGGKLVKSQVLGAATIMYRYHPRFKRFFFKFGMTPLVGVFDADEDKIQAFPLFGIAFGRAF